MDVGRVARWSGLGEQTLRKQYKNHLSGFRQWAALDHCEDYLLFPENLGPRVSIDEVSLSNGELYTLVTNKAAKGGKGSLIAIIKGTKASVVSDLLMRIPMKERVKVLEATLDMSHAMDWIVREAFPNSTKVTDRFHVQKLVNDALQQMRIKERWEAIDHENQEIQISKKSGTPYHPFTYGNGDTRRQLLARSRYLLFKPRNKWSESQKQRAKILFGEFPKLHEGYKLSMMFRSFYHHSKTRERAKQKLDEWAKKVEEKQKGLDKGKEDVFSPFLIALSSIQTHEGTILNYFPDRSTNASAESFNAKLKGFRSLVRGVGDRKFFLFRIAKIYG